MTSQEVADLATETISNYVYPTVEGTVGTPWDADRVADELALLRQCLVEPTLRTLHVHQRPFAHVWLVAVQEDVAVYFDEQRGEYGLGSLAVDGSITDWGVYGDLVGAFMAR